MADVERDPRWENVYAAKGPYPHIHDEDDEEGECPACTFIHFRLDVYYKGGHYWRWQVIDRVDFLETISDPVIDKWIWEEMIKMVDEEMKGVT